MILSLMKKEAVDSLTRYGSYAAAVVLMLAPFGALLTTWLGSNFGHLDVFRIWKELIMIPLTLMALWLLVKSPEVLEWLKKSKLLNLILLYVGWNILATIFALWTDKVNSSAAIYALLVNSRFLIFFIVTLVLATRSEFLPSNWKKLVMWPAAAVCLFAALQIFVLPNDFLTHFGYGDTTIPAFHAIDQKDGFQRAQSTLRGPNPLGAYLVIILSAVSAWAYSKRFHDAKLNGLLLIVVLALFLSHSRSAWLGSLLAVGLFAWWSMNHQKYKKLLTVGLVGLAIIAGATLQLRNNDYFQNVVFHTDENSLSSDSSNEDRADALRQGFEDVVSEPWGRGPGTAGPASFRNDHSPRIAENYYLQIGQELGIFGMTAFLAVNLLVAFALWRRHDQMSMILIASLAGITLINMLSHAWADDTLAYVWWGLAGIALARPQTVILNKKRKH